MLSRLLGWLDRAPAHYWWAAWSAFGLLVVFAVALALVRRERTGWRSAAGFAGLLLLANVAFRWPLLTHNQQMADPDESQLMAGALTLRHDPWFWRSVDGTTHGPLVDVPLIVPLLAGITLDYANARTVALLLGWIAQLGAWLIFRRLFGAGMAGLLVLPLAAAYSFMHGWYFTAYCTEQLPSALLAIGCVLLLCAWDPAGVAPQRGRLLAAGVCLGAIPFAKIQAAPIAATAIAGGVVLLAATTKLPWRERGRGAFAFVAGSALVPALILLGVVAGGLWPDFWQCYIANNLQYAGGRWFTWAETPGKFIELGGWAEGFNPCVLWLLGFAGCGLFALPWCSSWHRRCVAFAVALALAAGYATMAPGRMFMHYLQLMFFPVGLLAGVVAGAILHIRGGRPGEAPAPGWRQAVAGVVFLGCGLVPQLIWRARTDYPELGQFAGARGALQRTEVSLEVLRHARAGERLGIWGWMPKFWVETAMLQATRDGNGSRQIENSPDRDYYRNRFLADLRRNAPPVFVDAVGDEAFNFGYHDRAKEGHETFPDLATYVAANYRLVRDVEGSRIYVRNDRL